MNHLTGQTSPYLLQHADNPVDWWPWDAAALAEARRLNKPILLSIGYSACHWCHVMAHESFEDADTAALMNEHFVNIKVDREERPDLDRIYQTAHQLLTRNRGGWPLTMFLDPDDHMPFFGGTYFPPAARHGLPAFADLLRGIATAYTDKQTEITEFKSRMRDALSTNLTATGDADIDRAVVDRACGQLNAAFDTQAGGFGDAPKFPHPAGLALLLEAAACSEDQETSQRLLYMLDFTLAAMSCGGLFDHLGGGFYRYSVDNDWTIPHFEKMLYDNGPLLELYALRAQQTESPWFRRVAEATADWLVREMQLDDGGLSSSLDADQNGLEGAYYVWGADEVRAVLGAHDGGFADAYGLNGPANFDGRWHLRLADPASVLARPECDPGAAFTAQRARLFTTRLSRPAPARDDKVLTSWNALGASALAQAGQLLARPDYIEAATRIIDYIAATHCQGQRLLATSRQGRAHLDAYLDDYAFLLDALLRLLSVRWRDSDLTLAIAMADAMLLRFEDRVGGGLFFTANDHEPLLSRPKSFADDSLPAGNGVAARALLELAHLLGEQRYASTAEKTLRAAMNEAERAPQAHASIALAILDYAMPPPRLILRSGDADESERWRQRARTVLGTRLRSYVIPPAARLPGILDARITTGAPVTAYLCVGHQCSEPASDADTFAAVLKATG